MIYTSASKLMWLFLPQSCSNLGSPFWRHNWHDVMQYFYQDQFLHNDSSIPAARGKGVCDILAMPLCSILVLLLMAEIRRSPVEVGSLSHYLQGFEHPRWCRLSAINSMIIFCSNIDISWCLFRTKMDHFQVFNLLNTLTQQLEVMFSSLCCWWSEQDGQCSVDSWASERATRGAARLHILQT